MRKYDPFRYQWKAYKYLSNIYDEVYPEDLCLAFFLTKLNNVLHHSPL